MKLQKGLVVRASAGRDMGGFFIILDCDEKYCLIADGKSRKLSSPKRKNTRHISPTDNMIDLNDITDKKLRTLLRQFSAGE